MKNTPGQIYSHLTFAFIVISSIAHTIQTCAEKCVPSKHVRIASRARRSSKIAKAKSHGPSRTKIIAVKTTKEIKCEDGTLESTTVEDSIVSEGMEVKAQGSVLLRTRP